MSALALPDLAEAIEREHQAAHQAARTALEHALECGRLLLEAKAAVPHGEWLPWLEANTSVSARQSQRYMRLATAALEGKYDAASHLTIEGALQALAEPREREHPTVAAARAIESEFARIRQELDVLSHHLDQAAPVSESGTAIAAVTDRHDPPDVSGASP